MHLAVLLFLACLLFEAGLEGGLFDELHCYRALFIIALVGEFVFLWDGLFLHRLI